MIPIALDVRCGNCGELFKCFGDDIAYLLRDFADHAKEKHGNLHSPSVIVLTATT